jgi:hypothetical protein
MLEAAAQLLDREEAGLPEGAAAAEGSAAQRGALARAHGLVAACRLLTRNGLPTAVGGWRVLRPRPWGAVAAAAATAWVLGRCPWLTQLHAPYPTRCSGAGGGDAERVRAAGAAAAGARAARRRQVGRGAVGGAVGRPGRGAGRWPGGPGAGCAAGRVLQVGQLLLPCAGRCCCCRCAGRCSPPPEHGCRRPVRPASAPTRPAVAVLELTRALLPCRRRALLHAGRAPLAAAYLPGLPPQRAEALVVSVAREILDSAPALDSPEISEAKRCLELASQSDAAAAELQLMSALGQLQRQGLALLPAEVRQMQDRLQVVDRLLAARPDAYERQEQVRRGGAAVAGRACVEVVAPCCACARAEGSRRYQGFGSAPAAADRCSRRVRRCCSSRSCLAWARPSSSWRCA